ncbi:MAG: histidine kinase, partial [Clostridia bacterium]|nr:histidine kinase [Clostridia bacterium]
MRITSYFRTWRNRTALGKQLSRVLNLLLFLLLIPLLLYFQTAQSRVNLAHEAASVKRVLALEAVRLEDYIAELGDYSLQLRNDSGFMGLLSREGELDYARQRTVESALRMLYYSRDDIEWMELYLVKSRAAFRIESARRKVLPLAYRPPEALDDYDAFIAAPNYLSIQPDATGFVRVTRTIIDSPRTTPLAVVRFLADSSIPDAMARSHSENGEKLYLFSPEGVSLTHNGDEAGVLAALDAGETALGGRKDRNMLAGFRGQTGLTLAVLKPIALINAALGHYSAVTTVLVALALGLGLLLSEAAIRLFTQPVRDLARRMQDVGQGGDGTRGGEQLGLSAEANHMLAGISVLMDRSHVSELNARAARLAALEAQTNPHFLFNTLQAIATEAILAGDDKVYRMVTALAALMRYTIKGGNLVKLSTELE